MEIIIRAEKVDERAASEEILRQAYGRDAEVRLAENLRLSAEFNPNLSLVAADGSRILGYALYTRVTVAGNQVMPAAALAVMGVRPENRKMGVAERLVRHGLERCRGLRIDLVFAADLPQYLARIGFRPAGEYGLAPDWAVAAGQFTVFDLSGSMLGKVQGTVNYPAPFHGASPS
ncbi:MAG: N-acetyltransferase [Elusimicrobia bacterium]|nr:N-acetyltransferase [Elusimicrobiota bacterium]